MPEQQFLPYDYAESALDVRVDSIVIDAAPADANEIVEPARCSLNFTGRQWRNVDLAVHVSDPNNEIPSVLLDGETAGDAVAVLAVVRAQDARWRRAVRLAAGEPGTWTGRLTVDHGRCRGSLSLEVVAVRARDGSPAARRAWRLGERVAGSAPWTVYVDQRPIMPGASIDGRWRDFAADPLEALRSRKDCAWYLDLTDRDHPKLYLNEAVEGLKRALEVTQRIGRAARVRDALEHSVLQPVLMTMGMCAVEEAKDKNLEEITGWQKNLLLCLAGLCDGATEEEQVEMWLAEWKQGARATVLAALGTAVQRHLRVSEGAKYLVAELEQQNNG